jgi:hypothetical protein
MRDSVNVVRDREIDLGYHWTAAVDNAAFHKPVLDVLCALLKLGPHWWEMLRVRLLPRIPSLITVTDPQRWISVEEAFASDRATRADAQHAATFLLLDAWLCETQYHSQPNDSRFHRLASLTRESRDPELRIANCIRDIALGDKSRTRDLRAILRSRDPAVRQMLVDAFLVDPGDQQEGQQT